MDDHAIMAILQRLLEEVDRIVKSPYPTQLKGLHDICLRCSHLDITAWRTSRPCQVHPLIRIILEARSTWPYTLDLITILSHDVKIRDALLQHDRNLLYSLITKAVDNAGSGRYHDAAIAMLSHPLPPGITLPVESQSFFLGVLDHAAEKPSEQSVKTVYTVLKGAMLPLLGILSKQLLDKLEKRLLTIVSSTQTAEGGCFGLYALAAMSSIIQATQSLHLKSPVSSFDTDDLLAGTPASWTPTKIHAFFDGRKATKTLQLVVLRALWACRLDCDSSGEAHQALSLAHEVVRCLPQDIRVEWCQANTPILQKFEEKVLLPGLEDQTQCLAMLFLCTLLRPAKPPRRILTALTSYMSDTSRLVKVLNSCAPSDLKLFLSVAEPAMITALLTAILATTAQPNAMPSSISMFALISAALTDLMDTGAIDANTIVRAVHSSATPQILDEIHSLVSRHGQPELDGSICRVAFIQSRDQLVVRTSALLIRAALQSSQSAPSIDKQTYNVLLNLHSWCSQTKDQCTHATKQLHQVELTPAANLTWMTGMPWRDALELHYNQLAATECGQLKAIFTEACRDLESRCENAERPWKDEQARNAALQQQSEEMSRSYLELQEKVAQLEQQTQHEKALRLSISEELQRMSAENDALTSRLQEQQRRFDTALEEHATHVKDISYQHNDTNLAHAISTAEKQAQIDGLAERLTMEQALRQEVETQHRNTQDKSARLLHDLDTTAQALQELQTLYAAAQADAYDAKDSISRLSSERDVLNVNLQMQSTAYADNLSTFKQQAHDELNAKLKSLVTEHNSEMSEKDHHHLKELASAQALHEEASNDIASLQDTIGDWARQYDHLKASCRAKDDHIEKLTAIRDNMMAAMGLSNAHSDDMSVNGIIEPPVHRSTLDRSSVHHRKSASLGPATALRRAASDVLPSITPSQRRPLHPIVANFSPKRPQPPPKQSISKIYEDYDENAFESDELTA